MTLKMLMWGMAQKSEIAVDHEVFRVLVGLLLPPFSPEETWARK